MAVAEQPPPAANGAPAEDLGGWKRDAQGRKYVSARGRSGIIYRQGNETVEQAIERDAKGKDVPPRPKPKKKPPAPTSKSLKEIEHQLAEGLTSPAMVCAMVGEEWAANHFTQQGPALARQLVATAEHNEWIRKKLEAAAAGEDMAVKMMAILALCGAVVVYAGPPIIYFANVPVPERARAMYGIPAKKPKRPQEGPNAATTGTAPQPAGPDAA